MRAVAVFPAERALRLVDAPEPAIQAPAQVRLRVRDVGVCGTDREIARFEYGTGPAGLDHLILGHECLAEVVETGSEVSQLEPGDLVVPSVRRPCPHPRCRPCRVDRQDFCSTGDFSERGIKGLGGYMTEWIVEDARYLQAVPAELDEVAVLVEPLTIAEKALAQIWEVQERLPWECRHPWKGQRFRTSPQPSGECHRAVVLGAGPVGLLGTMALIEAGFETAVYSRELEAGPKARLVESLGARYISAETRSIGELSGELGSIDVVYEAAGASKPAFELLKELGPNGIFVFTGVPGRKAPIELDADHVMRRLVLLNQVVLGTVNAGPLSFAQAVKDLQSFMRRWPVSVRALISGRHPLEAAEGLLREPPPGIKHVISLRSQGFARE